MDRGRPVRPGTPRPARRGWRSRAGGRARDAAPRSRRGWCRAGPAYVPSPAPSPRARRVVPAAPPPRAARPRPAAGVPPCRGRRVRPRPQRGPPRRRAPPRASPRRRRGAWPGPRPACVGAGRPRPCTPRPVGGTTLAGRAAPPRPALERVVHRAVTQRDELVLPAHRDLVGDPRAQVLVGEPGGDRLAPETSTARRREPGDLAQRRRQLGHVRQHVRDQGQDPGAHRHRQLLQPHRLAHARPPRASRRPFVRHLDRPLDLSPA